MSSGAYLMASQLGTAGIGFVFWLVAARSFSTASVGLASAAISVMALLGSIGTLGMGTLLIREMPQHRGSEARMVAGALILGGAIGMLLSLGFAVVAPLALPEFGPLREPMLAAALIFGTGFTAAGLTLDQAQVGMQRSDLTLLRNVASAGGRLVLVLIGVLAGWTAGRELLLGAWALGLGLSFILPAIAQRRHGLRRALPPAWDLLARYRGAAAQHHLLNLTVQVPGWLMPIITVAVLSAATNAQFYVAWMLVGLGSFIPVALTWSLYAAASRDPDALHSSGRVTLAISTVAALLIVAGMAVFGELLLTPFGAAYTAAAHGPLPILALTLLAVVVKAHYTTIHRIRKTLRAATTILLIGAGLEVIGAALGATSNGLIGLSAGLLSAMTIETLLMAPTVYGAIIKSPVANAEREDART
jgi:O-antigen/teichoic acid export membrane protein